MDECFLFEIGKTILHESFNQQGNCLVRSKPSAHQIVELVTVDGGTGCPVSRRHLIGEYFQFRNCFGSGFLGKKEIFEQLTCIAVIGLLSDRKQAS